MNKSFGRGRRSEFRFLEAIKSKGLHCKKSSRKDDIERHIDFFLFNDDSELIATVDVKGENQLDEIWVELKNVRGDKGWIYGDATVIAFEMPELGGFVCVLTKHLRDYVKENVSEEFVSKKDAYKKMYTRDGRSDVITLLCIDDLKSIDSYKIIEYSDEYSHPLTKNRIKIK